MYLIKAFVIFVCSSKFMYLFIKEISLNCKKNVFHIFHVFVLCQHNMSIFFN